MLANGPDYWLIENQNKFINESGNTNCNYKGKSQEYVGLHALRFHTYGYYDEMIRNMRRASIQ